MEVSMKTILLMIASAVLCTGLALGQIVSAKSGSWTGDTTWVGGIVPTASDNVIISHTVTVETANAVCNDLTIANGGRLFFALTNGLSLSVSGSIVVDTNGRVQAASANPASGQYYQTIDIKKDLTVKNGGRFDMRQSSGANLAVGRVVFSGNSNSTISLALTSYTSTTEEFNSVMINKTGGAKVILASGNLFQNNNSTNGPDTLVLVSGVIETGDNTWVHLATNSTSIVGASSASYFNGKIGRGISNSGGAGNRDFPVGDSATYRPINLRVAAPANATGHYVWVQMKQGDANTGSSTFAGGIDKVSTFRHYEIGYSQNAGSAASMGFYGISPTYTTDDGVTAGNSDLRVAYSSDARATWNGIGPTNDTTDLSIVPSTIASDSIGPNLSVATGTSIYAALSRATGTITNPLEPEVPKVAIFGVSASSLNFGAIKINVTKKDSVVVSNSGDDTLKITSIISTSADFTLSSSAVSIAPAGSEKLYVTFAPTTVGVKSGAIIFAHNGASSPDTVTVSGTGDPLVSVRPVDAVPTEFAVHQNYPNPFNPSTMISFDLPERTNVKVEVFSILGTTVATLISGPMNAGTQHITWNATAQPSGVYFYRITTGTKSFTRSMVLLK